MLTHEILHDHTSHSYAALAGWSYIPTGAEIAQWDQYELEGRLKRKGWRPWTDKTADPFRTESLKADTSQKEREKQRERIRARFHIAE